MDGDSGILDNSREIKMRIKAFAYVYRMTNDTKWVDRAWTELQVSSSHSCTIVVSRAYSFAQNAVSDSFGPSGDEKWNPGHFLDTAEMTAAFGIAYDLLYDIWTDDQKSNIRSNMIQYGLNPGLIAFNNSNNQFWGWWTAASITGNWNCVCNSGLTMGAIAILGDDTSGIVESILSQTLPSALAGCANAVTSDGSWSETHAYWHFGTLAHSEMASTLQTATGSDYGLLDTNKAFGLNGLFHMYGDGPGTFFMWGDHGPNRFSTTANGMFLYGDHYDRPEYILHQRDQHDAPEPWSMFWYDTTVAGAFWDGLALDHFFDDKLTQWASMRSSWTDQNALFCAMKAGMLTGHQTHNDLDLGDFVIDAMGTRWAGELGSGDYRSPEYFSNDTQQSERWLYYRKRSEGQNAMLVNKENQLVTAAPTVNHGSSNTTQGSSTVFTPPSDSTAFWTADLTSGYDDT